jgi:hypothetical protein
MSGRRYGDRLHRGVAGGEAPPFLVDYGSSALERNAGGLGSQYLPAEAGSRNPPRTNLSVESYGLVQAGGFVLEPRRALRPSARWFRCHIGTLPLLFPLRLTPILLGEAFPSLGEPSPSWGSFPQAGGAFPKQGELSPSRGSFPQAGGAFPKLGELSPGWGSFPRLGHEFPRRRAGSTIEDEGLQALPPAMADLNRTRKGKGEAPCPRTSSAASS